MEIIIRPIIEDDNYKLAKMIREVFIEHNAPQKGTVYSDPTTNDLFKVFEEPKAIAWVAETNNEVVGCCGIYPTKGLPENCTEMVKFYLSAKARGKGIGKALMQKCVESAKQLGYKQLYLESLPHFSIAVGIYEKTGFVKLENPLGDSGHTSCTIWMLKEL